MKTISINGHILEKALLVDDPDVKESFTAGSGAERHIRSFTDPDKLKRYISKHPEGIIIAGVGVFFFKEPVPVSSAMVSLDESGSVNILIRDGAEEIEKQLASFDSIREAATGIVYDIK